MSYIDLTIPEISFFANLVQVAETLGLEIARGTSSMLEGLVLNAARDGQLGRKIQSLNPQNLAIAAANVAYYIRQGFINEFGGTGPDTYASADLRVYKSTDAAYFGNTDPTLYDSPYILMTTLMKVLFRAARSIDKLLYTNMMNLDAGNAAGAGEWDMTDDVLTDFDGGGKGSDMVDFAVFTVSLLFVRMSSAIVAMMRDNDLPQYVGVVAGAFSAMYSSGLLFDLMHGMAPENRNRGYYVGSEEDRTASLIGDSGTGGRNRMKVVGLESVVKDGIFRATTEIANIDPFWLVKRIFGGDGDLRRRLQGSYSQDFINVLRRYKRLIEEMREQDVLGAAPSYTGCPVEGCSPALTVNNTKFNPLQCSLFSNNKEECENHFCDWDEGACRDLFAGDPNTLYCGKYGCHENEDDATCNLIRGDDNALKQCPANYYESRDRDHHSVCHIRKCTTCDDSDATDLYCGQRSCSRDLNSDDLSGQDNCTGSNQANLVECPCGYYHKEFINATGGTIFDCDVRHCVKNSPYNGAPTIYCGKDTCDVNYTNDNCNLVGFSDDYLLKCPNGYTQHGEKTDWKWCSKRVCKLD